MEYSDEEKAEIVDRYMDRHVPVYQEIDSKSHLRRQAVVLGLHELGGSGTEGQIVSMTNFGGSYLSHALVGLLHTGTVEFLGGNWIDGFRWKLVERNK